MEITTDTGTQNYEWEHRYKKIQIYRCYFVIQLTSFLRCFICDLITITVQKRFEFLEFMVHFLYFEVFITHRSEYLKKYFWQLH